MTYRWIIRQVVKGTDGTKVGLMVCPRTFVPYPGLFLAGCGIFRNADQDLDPVEIESVAWIDTPQEGHAGSFLVYLEDDWENEGKTCEEMIQLYGPKFQWT